MSQITKKEISLALFVILLAALESKVRLWSGYAPHFLIPGLIGLAATLTMVELVFYTLLGFVFLAGPILSQELLVLVVLIAFVHFLRVFVFGASPFLAPLFSIAAVLLFYIETVGLVVFRSPLFLLEICFVSLFISFLAEFLAKNIETPEA